MSLHSSTDYENGWIALHKLISSTCHSRAGGNPGLFSAVLAWIPAFAGMTDAGGLCVARIIPAQVFSKESMKFGILIIRTLRVLGNTTTLNYCLHLRKLSSQTTVARPPQGACHAPLHSDIVWGFISRPLRSLRLIIRFRTGPVATGPYSAISVPKSVDHPFYATSVHAALLRLMRRRRRGRGGDPVCPAGRARS